jgi:hypothetical protein
MMLINSASEASLNAGILIYGHSQSEAASKLDGIKVKSMRNNMRSINVQFHNT